MKRIHGRGLDRLIREAPDLAGRLRLMPHLLDVCRAVAYAHSMGVLHRDLKPSNVMVGAFGETVVLDWGLARVSGEKDAGRAGPIEDDDLSLTWTGSVLGSPGYMSPEQSFGAGPEVDERSDVWALGAVLHAILTGHAPYPGAALTHGGLRMARIPPVLQNCPDAPEDLAAIADRALSMDPARRYPTALALAADVERWLAGRLVHAHQYSWLHLTRAFVQRHRGAVGLVCASAVVLSTMGWASVSRIRQERENAIAAEGRARASLGEALAQRSFALARSGQWPEAAAAAATALEEAPPTERADLRGVVIRALTVDAPTWVHTWFASPPCQSIAARPDDGLVMCGAEGGLHVWTESEHRWIPDPVGNHRAIAWAGGDQFVVGSAGGRVVRWDGRTAEARASWTPFSSEVRAIDASEDGTVIVAGASTGERWTWIRGVERLRVRRDGVVLAARLSPDARRVAWAGAGAQGTEIEELGSSTAPVLAHGPGAAVYALAWSDDGSRLAIGAASGEVDVVATDDGAVSRRLRRHAGVVTHVSFVGPGRLLTTGVDGTVRLWDVEGEVERDRAPLVALGVPTATVTSRSWWQAGGAGLVQRWDLTRSADGFGDTRAGTIDPWSLGGDDGRFWVSTTLPQGNSSVVLFDPSGHPIRVSSFWSHDPSPMLWPLLADFAWNFDSRLGPIERLDLVHATSVPVAPVRNGRVGLGARSPDGSRVALLDEGGDLSIRQIRDDVELCHAAVPFEQTGPANLTNLGLWWRDVGVIDVGPEGDVAIRDGEHCRVLSSARLPPGRWSLVEPSPDGQAFVIAGGEGAVARWSMVDGTLTPWTPTPATLTDLVFLAEGTLVAGGSVDGRISVWRWPEGELLARIPAHDARVVSLATDGGEVLVSSSWDRTLRGWSLGPAQADSLDLARRIRARFGLGSTDGAFPPTPP